MFTFGKHQRINSKKAISLLLEKGEVIFRYPFTVYFRLHDESDAERGDYSRYVISVPKKNFKRAVARNLIKRRSREAFRLNQHTQLKRADYLFVYVGKDIADYELISARVKEIFSKVGA